MRNRSCLLIGIVACSLAACSGDDDDDTSGTGGSEQSGRTGGSVGQSGGSGGRSGGGNVTGGTAGTTVGGEAGSGGAVAQLEDSEILKVLDTANTGEIEQGTFALTRAQSKSVQDFAQMMIDAHSAGKEKGQMVAEAQTITPRANPLSEELESASAMILVMLEATPDNLFDVTYMESQVEVHTSVLALIDDHLIPSAENAAVRSLLTGARADVVHHLESAQATLDELNGGDD